jgi:hypothetical protein
LLHSKNQKATIMVLLALIIFAFEIYVGFCFYSDLLHDQFILGFSVLFSMLYFVLLLFVTLRNKNIKWLIAINMVSISIYHILAFFNSGLLSSIIGISVIYIYLMTIFAKAVKNTSQIYRIILLNICHIIIRLCITIILLAAWTLGSMGV